MIKNTSCLVLCALFFGVGVFADEDASFSTLDKWKVKEKCSACKQKCKCTDSCTVPGSASLGSTGTQTINEMNPLVRFGTIGRRVGKGVSYTPFNTFVLEPGTYYVHAVVYPDVTELGTNATLSVLLDGATTGLTTPDLVPLLYPSPLVVQGFVSVTGNSCSNLTLQFLGSGFSLFIPQNGASISIIQLEEGC